MKKTILISLLLVFVLAIASFGQNNRIDQYLGQSQASIQKNWGTPLNTTIDKDGYVVFKYYYNYTDWYFYFYANTVEKVQSIIVYNNYTSAEQHAGDLDDFFVSNGFWVASQVKNRVLYTNGYSNVLIEITRYNRDYIFNLVAFY